MVDLAGMLKGLIYKRIGGRMPDFYVSASAPVNKCAVRILMCAEGGYYCFPCSIHSEQLATRHAVTVFLDGSTRETDNLEGCDWETDEDIEEREKVANSPLRSAFVKISSTCRAIVDVEVSKGWAPRQCLYVEGVSRS